jgi:CRP-like cAMP-binding protein
MSTVLPETFTSRFPKLAASLPPADLEALTDAFQLHDADAGEALVSQDTWSDELFLVWDGGLDITVRGRTQEQQLAGLGPGSLFGDVSLLEPGPAGASVSTSQGCTVLRLKRDRFDRLRRTHPAAASSLLREVLSSLSARLQAARAYAQQGDAAGAAGRAAGVQPTPSSAGAS